MRLAPFNNQSVPRQGPFACIADRVFDGRDVLEDQAVLVDGDRVSDVMPMEALPAGMPVLREPGCTLIPGLIDIHTHFLRWEGPQFLAFGVTTIRDTGNPLDWILARRQEAPDRLWPRILCQGPLIDGPNPRHPLVSLACRDEAEAVAAVRDTAAAGVDGIKLYNRLDPAWLPAMVAATHEGGLLASMHCQASGMLVAAQAGVDEFFHLDGILPDVWPDHPEGWLELWATPEFAQTEDRQRELAAVIAHHGMVTTPTLAYWDCRQQICLPGFAESAGARNLPAGLLRWHGIGRPDPSSAEQWRRALEAALRFVGMLLDLGAPVLPGSDTPCGPLSPGISLWRELELLVSAGMSPLNALRAATSDAAAFLRRPELGSLRAGSVADMSFVRGNPTESIPAYPEVVAVLRGGTVYDPRKLLADSLTDGALVDEDEPWSRQFRAHSEPAGSVG